MYDLKGAGVYENLSTEDKSVWSCVIVNPSDISYVTILSSRATMWVFQSISFRDWVNRILPHHSTHSIPHPTINIARLV